MLSLSRSATNAAATGGVLWTVKALAITVNDGSVQPAEGVLFLGGLAALLVACALVAAHLARNLRTAARVAATAGGFVALCAITVMLEAVGNGVIGGLATGDNVGLEEEGGILLAGLAWTALAVAAARSRDRITAPRAVAA